MNRQFLLWGVSFGVVACLHFGMGAYVIYYTPQYNSMDAQTSAAIMVDLAPVPAAPPEPLQELPPDPIKEISDPPLEPEPEPQIEPEPIPKSVTELPNFETVLPVEPSVISPPIIEKTMPPRHVSPPTFQAPVAEQRLAPIEGAMPQRINSTSVNWQSILLGHLEKHKRYPREARRRHQEGVVFVHIVIDRTGMVLTRTIEQSSGSRLLDQEALRLMKRAQPLPEPPSEIKGTTIDIVVPIEFYLK